VYAAGIALLSAFLFGAATPASKALLTTLEPFQLAGLLYLGAGLGMTPVVGLEARNGPGVSLAGANRWRLAGAVLFGGVLGPVLLLAGLQWSLAGSVSLLLNLEGVATAVLGVVLFREHLGAIGWCGVAGVLAASTLVAGGGDWPGMVGGLFTAGACLCWAIDNHLTALIDVISAERSTLVKGFVAGGINLALGLATSPWIAPLEVVGTALAVGALSYGASIALYIRSAQALGATRAQAVFATSPFVGAGLSVVFLHEALGFAHVTSAFILIPSIAALFWSRHFHLHAHPPLEHVHSHRHDDGHHLHAHDDAPTAARHSHPHRHDGLIHAHPHWPDVHHRHDHTR
jgi:drug/metabolite transporter (DMT)-like permease